LDLALIDQYDALIVDLERTILREAKRHVADAFHWLRSVPGIGVWTSAEVRQRVLGDPDAVSVGDYHLPSLVGWALAGVRTDDTGMLTLLEPYRGHRHRAVRLIELSGQAARPPRHGPRFSPRDYRAI